MVKKTDKSPVEQIEKYRQWLQSNMPKALAKFNELFPEVQELPIQEGKVRIEGGELVIKDGIASSTPLRIVPIQDIDALAEEHAYKQVSRDTMGIGLFEAAKQDWLSGYKQCLEDRGSDAVDFAEWIGNNLWEMIITPNTSWVNADTKECKTTEQLYQFWQDSKNKQHQSEDKH